MITLAIDCRAREGIGTLIRNIAIRLGPSVRRLYLLGHPETLREWRGLPPNAEIVPFAAPIYGWREQLEFPLPILRSCNLLHIPHFNVPLRRLPCPMVCTIHDVAHLAGVLPISAAYKAAARFYCTQAFKRSARVITDSQFSRQEIAARLHVEADRMTVISGGVDTEVFHPRSSSDAAPVLARLGIRSPYLMTLGSIRPHKNVGRLLHAYERLKTREGIPHQLVIVGRREGFRIKGELPALRKALMGEVVFTEFLSEEEITALYTFAELFVFPSIYEGFGLPPLEAMACGAPVAVSRAASLPEVVGEAGAYFDPFSAEDIARKIFDLIANPAERGRLSLAGRARAQQFDFETATRAHMEVYERYAR